MSKQAQIWKHLLEGHTLTQEQARIKFNHWRLASAVQRLRRKGVDVATHLIGEAKFAQYHVPASARAIGKPLLIELNKKAKVAK